MISFKSIVLLLLKVNSVLAAVLPKPGPSSTLVTAPTAVINSTITAFIKPTPSVDCSYKWCQNSTSFCLYWAGITGYDPSLGPIPGMVHTSIGSCAPPNVTSTFTSTSTKEHIRSIQVMANNVQLNEITITPAPTSSIDCDYKYCQNNNQYCMYWAGVTGFDISLGPIPGMTRTSLGTCEAPPSVSQTAPATLATTT
ncbi:hypothetical protein CPLU01_01668 [Colletotrichum plurivorum]|uniref:LysM domain-containing protein n=1 Tax=Colletotrichum plurivorum TaxID=2175906 RepID=A0A8H6U391_9PEZI|nr:hypothetical protein CPLU01_01668 [Colletotrichum plurivorum]